MNRKALLFSGHNQRAIIALCRYFNMVEIEFIIVSSGDADPIYKTEYKNNVIFERADNTLTLELFKKIGALNQDNSIVYCPTSEYLNHFMLINKLQIEKYGIKIGLPPERSYTEVSNKFDSQELLTGCTSISIIDALTLSEVKPPCVAKPIKNIFPQKTLYPIICKTQHELNQVLNKIEVNDYFFQHFVHGQSYYICGYLNKSGEYDCFWQENLLQQPGGKSIVFATASKNPGIDEQAFFERVHMTGYHGPIMAEFIKSSAQFFFIEINPRFWGPLQLMIDSNSGILNLYLDEWFNSAGKKIGRVEKESNTYYSWYKGSCTNDLLKYPAYIDSDNMDTILKQYDVYNRVDTKQIHMIV